MHQSGWRSGAIMTMGVVSFIVLALTACSQNPFGQDNPFGTMFENYDALRADNERIGAKLVAQAKADDDRRIAADEALPPVSVNSCDGSDLTGCQRWIRLGCRGGYEAKCLHFFNFETSCEDYMYLAGNAFSEQPLSIELTVKALKDAWVQVDIDSIKRIVVASRNTANGNTEGEFTRVAYARCMRGAPF